MSCGSGGKSKTPNGLRGPGTPCKSEKEASVDFFNAIGIRTFLKVLENAST
jgi:hypothetical protein